MEDADGRESISLSSCGGWPSSRTLVLVLVAIGMCIRGSGRQLLEAEAPVVASATVTSTAAP